MYCTYVMKQRSGPVSVSEQDGDDLTSLLVPQEAVGFVTGRQGNFLRSIEDEWCVLMLFAEFDKDRGREKDMERLCIFGKRRARRGAELKVLSAIESKVDGHYRRF